MPLSQTELDAIRGRWKPYWASVIYTSATNLSVNGNSGIVAMPITIPFTADAIFGRSFSILGNGITTDETLALTLDFYANAAGTPRALGTITFATLTASALTAFEAWPGDLTPAGFAGMIPVPPFFQASWVLAGTTKSMGFTLYGDFYAFQ